MIPVRGKVGISKFAETFHSNQIISARRVFSSAKASEISGFPSIINESFPRIFDAIGIGVYPFIAGCGFSAYFGVSSVLSVGTWPKITISIIQRVLIVMICLLIRTLSNLAVHVHGITFIFADCIPPGQTFKGIPVKLGYLLISRFGYDRRFSLSQRNVPARLILHIKYFKTDRSFFAFYFTGLATLGNLRFDATAFLAYIIIAICCFLFCCKISTRLGTKFKLGHDSTSYGIVRSSRTKSLYPMMTLIGGLTPP